jgi:hypothetical protein
MSTSEFIDLRQINYHHKNAAPDYQLGRLIITAADSYHGAAKSLSATQMSEKHL